MTIWRTQPYYKFHNKHMGDWLFVKVEQDLIVDDWIIVGS